MNSTASHLGRVLAVLVILGAVLQIVEAFGWLPAAGKGSTVDELVIEHQQRAALQAGGANIVFVGDSSCLMNLAAGQLAEASHGRWRGLNLGTMSFMPLRFFATLASNAVSEADNLTNVVLLLNPVMLARDPTEEAGARALELLGHVPKDRWARLAGTAEILRKRVIAQVVPAVLPGPFGERYGLNWNLLDELSAANGSLIDPHPQLVRGEQEARWALTERRRDELEKLDFRQGGKVRLYVGLTPIPRESAGAGYELDRENMLAELAAKTGGRPLVLPATYPSRYFATPTHLNEVGRIRFTLAAAEALAVASRE